MEVLRTVGIFVVAAAGEIGGAYAVWRWRRLDDSAWLILAGLAALLAYAVVQTYQPEDRFGRLYAAYAGVFLVGAMTWGWLIDGARPDRFDLLGALLVIVGAATILWGRELLA